jgi:hypothetical protein
MLAIAVVLSALLSRALLPGVRGAVVGISGAIDAADIGLGVLAQLTAIVLLGASLLLTIRVVRARAPVMLKIGAILLDGITFFAVVGSMVTTRTPLLVTTVACLACSLTAIVMGISAVRRREVGFVALAPVLAGVASLVRGIGAVITDQASAAAADLESVVGAYRFATILATVSFVLATIALGLVAAWVVLRSRRVGPWLVAGWVLVVAVIVRLAVSPPDDLEPVVVVVLRRGVQHLLTRPAPFLPEALPMALVVAAPLLALVVALQPRAHPALAGGLALSVLAADAADIPILGLALACGALSVAGFALDPYGVRESVVRADGQRDAERPGADRRDREATPEPSSAMAEP